MSELLDLELKKELLSQQCTALSEEIKEINKELNKPAILKGYVKDFERIADLVGQMFKMAFELYVFRGVDIKLALTNHVKWLECDINKHLRYDYAIGQKALVPDLKSVNALYDKVKEIHIENGLS
jgi:hypothetical protein